MTSVIQHFAPLMADEEIHFCEDYEMEEIPPPITEEQYIIIHLEDLSLIHKPS